MVFAKLRKTNISYVITNSTNLQRRRDYILQSDVHGSVHRKPIFKYNQQDATLHNLFISVKFSDDGRRNRLKHVEHYKETNKLCNVASCCLYIFFLNEKHQPDAVNTKICCLYLNISCSLFVVSFNLFILYHLRKSNKRNNYM